MRPRNSHVKSPILRFAVILVRRTWAKWADQHGLFFLRSHTARLESQHKSSRELTASDILSQS